MSTSIFTQTEPQHQHRLHLKMMPQTRFVVSPYAKLGQMKDMSTSTSTSTTSSDRKPTFKTWPLPMVESRGDYREETYLEDLIGGALYPSGELRGQASLPRLPIPEIKDTISTLIPTALPLAESEEEARTFLEKCKSFPTEAEILHRRLIARRDGEMKDSSWLQLWWNTAGYLQVRDPIVVNVSYFFHFADDKTLGALANKSSSSLGSKSLGIRRGASILHATAEFRKNICTGTFPQETIGRKDPKTPLCSVAFKYMFNSCRIPRREQDTYRMYDPSLHRHCIVTRKGSFFAVDFLDEFGNALPLHVIEDRLQRCIELSDTEEQSDHRVPKFGWLTSSDRDSWADAREEMLRVGGSKMKSALEKLESGAIMLCLDDEKPIARSECGDIFWTGGLSSGDNRWFDKSIQIMCTENGKAGLIGEHSMMDGMPMIAYANHITTKTYSDAIQQSDDERMSSSANIDVDVDGGIENIFQDCYDSMSSGDSNVDSMIAKAKDDFTTLINDHELNVKSFQGYGSDTIKKYGYSPDAYAQMAIQLAVYRLLGKVVGTYEATQMRSYLHGRTETTRTVSPASETFVKRMGLRANFKESQSAKEDKRSLLQKAVESHVKYIGNAAKGKGVDRHLLGMSMLVNDSEKIPALYSDPLFVRAKTWRVSTSHLPHPNFENWGFGEVVPDGVGVGYAVNKNSCVFNVTARKEHNWTERLSHLLEEALVEMEYLNDVIPKSRL